MRWYWFDRFTEFVSGQHAKTIKNVSLAEEQVQEYQPNQPLMPSSLIVEGLAQTGGLLVGQTSDFTEKVVLAKVVKAKFHFDVQPGHSLVYEAKVETLQSDGAIITGTSHMDGELQADFELMFAYLGERFDDVEQFAPIEFLRMLKIWRLFDVGVNPDGSPIDIPKHMVEAERASRGQFQTDSTI